MMMNQIIFIFAFSKHFHSKTRESKIRNQIFTFSGELSNDVRMFLSSQEFFLASDGRRRGRVRPLQQHHRVGPVVIGLQPEVVVRSRVEHRRSWRGFKKIKCMIKYRIKKRLIFKMTYENVENGVRQNCRKLKTSFTPNCRKQKPRLRQKRRKFVFSSFDIFFYLFND